MTQRVIKLRFWEPTHGHFFYATPRAGQVMLWEHDKECTAQPIGLEKNYDLQMFTGLHDKNGVEVFEGDIVEHRDYIGTLHGKYEVRQSILGWTMFDPKDPDTELRYITPKELEVIGNVWQNPGLI